MKRLQLTIAVLIFSVGVCFAQPFKGGVAAGLVGSQVDGDTYSGYDKLGGYVGFWVRLDLNERSSLQTEISYCGKGSHYIPPKDDPDPVYYLMRLDYIEMPFLYQYHFRNKFTVEAGPSICYLLHSYEERNYMEISYGKFAFFNPAFIEGISYQATEQLGIHLRFDNSLLSIRKDHVDAPRSRLFDNGQFNNCLMLFVSYKL